MAKDKELREDIAAAKAKMSQSVGSGREIKRLAGHLWEDETVELMTSGRYGKGQGLMVLTDRRLFFVKDGMTSSQTEDFPLSKVSSIQWSTGMMWGTITIFASGNKAEINNVPKSDGKAIVDHVRDRLHDRPAESPVEAPSTAASDTSHDDTIAAIEQLKRLHEQGILTDEEFAAKKTELLGRL